MRFNIGSCNSVHCNSANCDNASCDSASYNTTQSLKSNETEWIGIGNHLF